jgi:hypothetical protein
VSRHPLARQSLFRTVCVEVMHREPFPSMLLMQRNRFDGVATRLRKSLDIILANMPTDEILMSLLQY